MSGLRIKKPSLSGMFAKRPRVRIAGIGRVGPMVGSLSHFIQKMAVWFYYNPIVQVAFIAAVLISLNVIGNRFFWRFDVTRYDQYTFNKTTSSLVNDLDETLNVRIFLSSDLPAGINTLPRDITDFYTELKRLNTRKVNITMYSPKEGNDDVAKANEYGIQPIPYANYESDKATVGEGYLGVGFDYGDQRESIPAIRDASSLEFQTILILRKMLITDKPIISFVTGHGEKELQAEYPDLYTWLLDQFTIKTLTLTEVGQEELNESDLLVIAAPAGDYTEDELQMVDQYIMSGKRALFLMEGYLLSDSDQAQPVSTNVFDLLESYGITTEQGMLMDKSYNPFRAGSIPLEYPYWLRIPKSQMDRNNELLDGIEQINLEWAVPLKVDTSGYESNRKPDTTVLFKTSKEGALFMGESVPIALQQAFTYPNPGQRSVGVQLEGYIHSHYRDGENDALATSTSKGNIVAIGDADFMLDWSNFGVPSSTDFFLRLMYWGAGDKDMLAWKPNVTIIPWSRTLTETETLMAKLFNYAMPLVVLGLVGVGVYIYQRRSQPKF